MGSTVACTQCGALYVKDCTCGLLRQWPPEQSHDAPDRYSKLQAEITRLRQLHQQEAQRADKAGAEVARLKEIIRATAATGLENV